MKDTLMALLNFRRKEAPAPDMPNPAVEAFLQDYSIEVMPRTAEKVENFRDLLPAGTRVYIAHIEGTLIEDMVATRNISALVILPFESEPLTSPVQAVADSGIWVTVVDRGLSVEGIEDLYVAGDNAGFGKVSGEFMVSQMPDGGNIEKHAQFTARHGLGHIVQ